MLEFVHGSIDLNEWRVNFEGGREGKTKACRLRHLTERILYLLLSSIWKRTRMLFTHISVDARSSWTLFPSDTTNTRDFFPPCAHTRLNTSYYPIIREISRQFPRKRVAKVRWSARFYPVSPTRARIWIPQYIRNIRIDTTNRFIPRSSQQVPPFSKGFENDRFKHRFDSSRKKKEYLIIVLNFIRG